MLPAFWPPPDPERSAAERLQALLELEIAADCRASPARPSSARADSPC